MYNILEFDSNDVNGVLDELLYNYYENFTRREYLLINKLIEYTTEKYELHFNNKSYSTLYLLLYEPGIHIVSNEEVKIEEDEIEHSLKYKNKEVYNNILVADSLELDINLLLEDSFDKAYEKLEKNKDVLKMFFENYMIYLNSEKRVNNGLCTIYSYLFIKELETRNADLFKLLSFEYKLK